MHAGIPPKKTGAKRAQAAGCSTTVVHGTTRPPKRARRIRRLLMALCESSSVILRTDKTNQFYRADIADYNRWMLEHLASDAVEVPTEILIAAHQAASTFVQDELGDVLSASEQKYLTQKLDTRRVATPKLLVKNHKPARADGSYKTRFVIPADGFMAGLGKMAYLGLKGILDGYNVMYASRQIDQSYTLKKRLESRRFKQGEVTCISLDVVKMYPSMQYSLLKAAVEHFTARLPRDIRDTAAVCLKMLRFGMDRTFLQYGTKYYRYTGAGSDDDPGLTIGGFESAWLADLGLSYLLQEVPSIVRATEFLEVYRDDGIVFFDGAVDKQYIHNWVSRLQSKVDTITGSSAGEHMIEFTAVYWGDGRQGECLLLG